VNGKKIAKLDTDYIKQIEHYRFRLFAPSYGGDKVKLEYHGIDSLSFSVIEVALGFPDFDKVDPMPTHIIPGTGFESSVTVVKTTTTLPYKELVD
jgi:hypothetical protein